MWRRNVSPSGGRRRIVWLLCVLALGIAPLTPIHADAQPEQSPEVIAVENITALADCEIVVEKYADVDETKLIERIHKPCPAGAILHSKRMALSEAESKGLRYVVTTGVPEIDNAAHDNLKREIIASLQPEEPSQRANKPNTTTANLQSCSPAYYTRYLYYNPGDPASGGVGGRLEVAVKYKRNTYDCNNTLFLYESYIRFIEAPDPDEDLYWHWQSVNRGVPGYSNNWDMGCDSINPNGTPTYEYRGEAWQAQSGTRFTDETINDNSLWCTYWGEQYTGWTYLYL